MALLEDLCRKKKASGQRGQKKKVEMHWVIEHEGGSDRRAKEKEQADAFSEQRQEPGLTNKSPKPWVEWLREM